MIEQIMIFALGFLVAGILALLVLPLFWRRALRLSRRRVEMQMPLSISEVLADRDRLRAEFAVERCRLEQSIGDLSAKRAEALARESRGETAARALGAKLIEAETAFRASEERLSDIETQFSALSVELHDAHSLATTRSAALFSLQDDHKSLRELADERRATTASLETRLSSLEMRFADALRDLSSARSEQAQAIEQARLLEGQRDTARLGQSAAERLHGEMEARATEQGQRMEELSAALARAREELAAARDDIAHTREDLAHTREDLAQTRAENETLRRDGAKAEERAKALRISLERLNGNREGLERDLADRLAATQSHVAELKSALEEARRGGPALQRDAEKAVRRAGTREARGGLKALQVVSSEQPEDESDTAADPVLDRQA